MAIQQPFRQILAFKVPSQAFTKQYPATAFDIATLQEFWSAHHIISMAQSPEKLRVKDLFKAPTQ